MTVPGLSFLGLCLGSVREPGQGAWVLRRPETTGLQDSSIGKQPHVVTGRPPHVQLFLQFCPPLLPTFYYLLEGHFSFLTIEKLLKIWA